MHTVKLPAHLNPARDPTTQRGRYFARLDGPRTALLVVDMQKHWVDPDGRSYVETAAGIVPNINRMASALRQKGGVVVWVTVSFAAQGRAAWAMYFENLETATEARSDLTPGNEMHNLWPELDVQEQDLRVEKDRFSAFIAGASNLESALRSRSVDTVLVAGVATNICCESTARDAMMLDFRTVMIDDANAARTDDDHLAGLRTFSQVFGAVLSTDEIMQRLHA